MKHGKFFLAKLPENPFLRHNAEQMLTSLYIRLCVAAKSEFIISKKKTSKSPVTNSIAEACGDL